MKKKSRKYEDDLIEALRNPKEAAAYLNTHLEDYSEDSDELFLPRTVPNFLRHLLYCLRRRHRSRCNIAFDGPHEIF